MTRSEIIKIVESISYKPGFSIKFNREPRDVDMIEILFDYKTIDSTDFTKEAKLKDTLTIDLFYLKNMKKDMLIRMIYDKILDMERHEAGEFFRVDGELPYDPHKKG